MNHRSPAFFCAVVLHVRSPLLSRETGWCFGARGPWECRMFGLEAEGSRGCTCCSLRLLCGGVTTCSRGCCVAVCVGSGDNRETIHTRCPLRSAAAPLSPRRRSLCELPAPSFHFFSFTFLRCFPQIAILPLFIRLHACIPVSLHPSRPPHHLVPLSPHPSISFCLFNSHRNTNINSSSWELLLSFCGTGWLLV